MSWNLNVSGHIEGAVEDAKRLEEELMQRMKDVLSNLEDHFGVKSSSFSGQYTSASDIHKTE